MKRKYVYPVTTTAETMSINMLCASGGAPTPSHDTSSGGGGDPQNAI
ncbi:MAG: hypothetical protein II970_08590 [Paludibacteraceae bacterium]|nr:hypothetical protein [Paludibacteraceae bacterium]